MSHDPEELYHRLKPFAQGAFSGNIAEWPQLKPLLRDLFEYVDEVLRIRSMEQSWIEKDI